MDYQGRMPPSLLPPVVEKDVKSDKNQAMKFLRKRGQPNAAGRWYHNQLGCTMAAMK
jgi:hypothetical protein